MVKPNKQKLNPEVAALSTHELMVKTGIISST